MKPVNRENMVVHLKAMNSDGQLAFEAEVAVDPLMLMVAAESKEAVARENGRQFTEGAIPFWASEAFKAAKSGGSPDELHRLTLNVAMSAWLMASIYDQVPAEQFIRSNLHFTLLPGGAVKFDRIPKQVKR